MNSTRNRSGTTEGREAGIALVVTIITVLLLAGIAAALVDTNVFESGRKQAAIDRTQVLYIAEAGAKVATIDLERGGSGDFGTADAPVDFGGGHYWVDSTDNGDETFTVVSVGELRGERRAVEIVLAPEKESLFKYAMFGDLDLGASGTVFVDSYDSELGSYSDQATNWHVTVGRRYADANGSVGSNQNIQLRGGVVVLGNATPGPGYSVRISGANVFVDGATTPAATTTGLRAIEYKPPVAVSSLSFSGSDPVLSAGVYHVDEIKLSSSSTLHISGDVTLYVDDSFSISGQAGVQIDPDSSLTVYHAGSNFNLTGQGILNTTKDPNALLVYSLANTVKVAGTSEFYGGVYAPNGHVEPSGTSVIYGALVGRRVDIGGTAEFHYDEALSRSKTMTVKLKRVSWRRIDAAP